MGLLADSAKTPERPDIANSSAGTPGGAKAVSATSGFTTSQGKPKFKHLSSKHWQTIAKTAHQLSIRLAKEIESFWGHPVQVSFFSASTENQYFWRLDDFFVSQVALKTVALKQTGGSQDIAQLRMSDQACATLLDQILGPAEGQDTPHHAPFSFARLTNFEVHLLNRFSREVFSLLMKQVIKKEGIQPATKGMAGMMLNLIWTIQLESPQAGEGPPVNGGGKIILSLPLPYFKPMDMPSQPAADHHTLGFSPLAHALVDARLMIGKTKARLEDLKALELDDLLVLEDSSTSTMSLIHWEDSSRVMTLLPFQARISNPYDIEIPYTQEIAMMEAQQTGTHQNLWDNLQIDVSAEFFPTKIPLLQLKEMSEGEVVEIADLIHNKVRIHVEGRTVAVGELVIVGDKFGVRVVQLQGLDGLDTPPPSKIQMGNPQPAQAEAYAAGQPAGYGDAAAAQAGGYQYGETPLPPPGELDNYLNTDFDQENDSEGW